MWRRRQCKWKGNARHLSHSVARYTISFLQKRHGGSGIIASDNTSGTISVGQRWRLWHRGGRQRRSPTADPASPPLAPSADSAGRTSSPTADSAGLTVSPTAASPTADRSLESAPAASQQGASLLVASLAEDAFFLIVRLCFNCGAFVCLMFGIICNACVDCDWPAFRCGAA